MNQSGKSHALIELRMFLTTIILLASLIILAGTATWFIPAGEFAVQTIDGMVTRVFVQADPSPVPVWKILLAPIFVLTGSNGLKIAVIVVFILFIGGSFSIMNRCGILPAMLSSLVRRFSHNRSLFILISVIIFSLMGSALGIIEEIVPLILIFIPIAYRMGWDSITGVALPFLSGAFGFAAATFNPFTIGTAQKLADLPLFSGLYLRAPFFLLTTLTVFFFILRYTRRIEKNPELSPTHEQDLLVRETYGLTDDQDTEPPSKGPVLWIAFSFLLIVGVVLGGIFVPFLRNNAFPLITVIFLLMGVGTGLFAGRNIKEVAGFFVRGLLDFAPAILLILMASSVGYLIEEGKIMDTILHSIATRVEGMGAGAAAIMIYLMQMVMNFLVPSGTGQAALTIPILAPLGELIGISRQTVVLAYQFGDGFSNLIWPTNPMLLIAIGLGSVPYRTWLKWIIPIQLLLMIYSVTFLLIAVNIGYS